MNSFNSIKRMHQKIKREPKWSALGAGITGSNVKAFAFDSLGNLYVGGNFSGYKNDPLGTTTTVAGIAKWNGQVWSKLDSGVGFYTSSGTGYVNAIVCDSSDNLYIAGSFVSYGSSRTSTIQSAINIIKYDISNSSWSQLGPGTTGGGVNNVVYALALDSSKNLYVGGNFTGYYNSDGSVTTANKLAKYDTKTGSWSTVGAGTSGGGVSGGSGYVSTIVFRSGIIYFGGSFRNVGNATNDLAYNIAKWDGATFSKIDSINVGLSALGGVDVVYAIAIDSTGTLYAGGFFDRVNNATGAALSTRIYNIAKWNTTNGWSYVNGSSGIYYPCFSIVIDKSDNIYFGGAFSRMTQPATVMGVTTGDFNGIVKLSTTTWSAVGNGNGGGVDVVSSTTNPSPVYVMELYANKLYVGGIFTGYYDTKSSSFLTPANDIAVYG